MTTLPPKVLRHLDDLFEQTPGPYTLTLPSGRVVFLVEEAEWLEKSSQSLAQRRLDEDKQTLTSKDVLDML